MSKDYAKKTKRNSKNTRRPVTNNRPGVIKNGLWFAAGLLTGVIVTLTVTNQPADKKGHSQNPDKSQTEVSKQTTKPRFDFYTLLRESEVIVTDTDEPATELPPETVEPVIASGENQQQATEIYLLQVGSFKSSNDADSLRAGLLLLNLQASIEKVSPRQGETWHRVLVGPLTTRSEVADAREKLSSNNIDSLLLKRSR